MRVCLINPPSPFLEEMNIQPPLGLLYIAAMFEKYDQEVTVLDYGIKDYGVPAGFDIYGFSATTPQYPYAEEIAKKIDGYKILGGPHATSVDVSKAVWNVAVKGEGENAVAEILTKKYKTGPILIPEIVDNLDSIPFPARHLVELERYVRNVGGKRAATLIASRGCPFNCAYCDKQASGYYRRRSVENVVAEIDQLINEYNYTAFLFLDDSFTIDRKWVLSLCDHLKPKDVIWRCWSRVDRVDPNMLKTMANAGCIEIGYGIESGSDKILKTMNKQTTTKQGLNAVKWTKAQGMKVKAFLIGGFPLETVETLVETLNFIDKIKPDAWGLGTLTPIPGSDMWKNPKKYGIEEINTDFRQLYMVGHGGRGGISFTPSECSTEKLIVLRDVLLKYLNRLQSE